MSYSTSKHTFLLFRKVLINAVGKVVFRIVCAGIFFWLVQSCWQTIFKGNICSHPVAECRHIKSVRIRVIPRTK